MLDDLDLDALADPAARRLVERLLNVVEDQATQIAALKAEVQHLRDEIARLKGE